MQAASLLSAAQLRCEHTVTVLQPGRHRRLVLVYCLFATCLPLLAPAKAAAKWTWIRYGYLSYNVSCVNGAKRSRVKVVSNTFRFCERLLKKGAAYADSEFQFLQIMEKECPDGHEVTFRRLAAHEQESEADEKRRADLSDKAYSGHFEFAYQPVQYNTERCDE